MLRSFVTLTGSIVVFATSTPASAQNWSLSNSPLYEFGDVEGDSPLGFGAVTGVVLVGARIIVADGQSHRLVFVNARSGAYRAAGRFGGGPGEFRTIASIQRCHPSKAYVYDPGALRLSVFSESGEFERALDVRDFSASGAPPYELTCNTSGAFLAVNRSPDPPPGVGPRRPRVALRVYVDSARSWSAGTIFASERYFDGSNDFPRPLGLRTSVALGRWFWVLGTGETDSVSVYALADSGKRLRTFSTGLVRRPVSQIMVRDFVDTQLRSRVGRADTTALRALYRSLEFPDRLPAFRRILVGQRDEIWVEEYPDPTASVVRWVVFTAQGRRLGQLTVPESFQLQAIEESTLIGVWRGSDDVLRVRGYSFRRE